MGKDQIFSLTVFQEMNYLRRIGRRYKKQNTLPFGGYAGTVLRSLSE
jgi:hypothetical protein